MCSLVFKPLVPCGQISVLESTIDPVAEISMTSSLSLLVKIAQRAEFFLAHAIVSDIFHATMFFVLIIHPTSQN